MGFRKLLNNELDKQMEKLVNDISHVKENNTDKECKNCKNYISKNMGCGHPSWSSCVLRDDEDVVCDYVYHSSK